MIRFIMVNKQRDSVSGAEWTSFHTFEAECPDLEQALTTGGLGEGCYQFNELVGVEVIKAKSQGGE
jgi:hypothetical protein